MLERIEGKWIAMFARTFRLCGIWQGDAVAILSETQSRDVNVQLAELALHELGARAFHVRLPTPALVDNIPVRSTGASTAIGGLEPVIKALAAAHPKIAVHLYDAGHGFNCDQRASYDEAAAALARDRTLAFFEKHLA